jgi:hypothetical protein
MALLSGVILLMAFKYETVYAIVSKNWQIQDQFSLFNAGRGGMDVSITQGLKGGPHTMELTTADSKNIQTPRILLRGSSDYQDTEFYSGPRGAELLRLMIHGPSGDIFWSNGGALRNDQGGSLELGDRGTPYLDFSNDSSSDYDARLILVGDDALSFTGTRIGVDTYSPVAKLDVNGDIATRGGAPISSNNNNLAGVGIGWIGDQARIRVGGDGPGAKNGLSIQEVGNVTLLKVDEAGGVLNMTSDYGSICIGKC